MDTRTAIVEAYRSYVIETQSVGMSVADICSKANVSKKTFYNYFPSKHDLLAAILEIDFFDPVRQIRASFYPNQLASMSLQMNQLAFYTFYRNRELYLKLMQRFSEDEFFQIFITEDTLLNQEIYVAQANLTPAQEAERDYLCMFLASTCAASLKWWMHRGFVPDSSEVAALYQKWAFGYISSQEELFFNVIETSARH